MYIDVRYSDSAFKHIDKEDIKYALLNAVYDDVLDEDRESIY
jgi:hypothetical protein